jgi:hypothetical protein
MFPESFVQRHLLAYSKPGDTVFDPFCGRGTTVLESLLNGRRALGTDVNPVAACVAGAKARIPALSAVELRLAELQSAEPEVLEIPFPQGDFFRWCFSERTLAQILHLRDSLDWHASDVDRFIAALCLGALHGESHKTRLCFSNRMPRTISTKPSYSVRWWAERELYPPERDVFDILREIAKFRLRGSRPTHNGEVRLADARSASVELIEFHHSVSLVITSPPYLDTTDYAEDQWLRLWFLGGPSRPEARLNKDDRHTNIAAYWEFIAQAWQGSEALFGDVVTIVLRIGGSKLTKEDHFHGLLSTLTSAMPFRNIEALHAGETSVIRRRQTNSFRPGTSPDKLEHDFAFVAFRH